MNSRLKSIRPVLYTNELKQTVDFYVDMLGFTCANFNEDWCLAILQCDDIEIMVSLPNQHIPFAQPVFTGSFYINTDNVDAKWEQVKDKAKVCYPLETFDYGMREFAVYDNNGYLLQFGEEV